MRGPERGEMEMMCHLLGFMRAGGTTRRRLGVGVHFIHAHACPSRSISYGLALRLTAKRHMQAGDGCNYFIQIAVLTGLHLLGLPHHTQGDICVNTFAWAGFNLRVW